MSEKDRDEIAGVLTDREIDSLGAPWLAMAQGQPQAYLPPLPQPYAPKKDADNGDTPAPFSLGGSVKGSAGSLDKIRRIDPDVEMRLRYRRAF